MHGDDGPVIVLAIRGQSVCEISLYPGEGLRSVHMVQKLLYLAGMSYEMQQERIDRGNRCEPSNRTEHRSVACTRLFCRRPDRSCEHDRALVLAGAAASDKTTGEPYESGIVSTGSARLRLSANFYLVAMLFVIFDVEAVFIIAWALVVRDVGWSGYIGIALFIGILGLALLYEWRQGALDWVTPRLQQGTGRVSASARYSGKSA